MIPRRILGKLEARLVPFASYLELTRRCNWRCSHCFVLGSAPPRGPELSTAEILDGLAQMRALGVLFLSITGGEPTLRRDLLPIVRGARELGMAVTLMSNAARIGARLARALAAAEVCEVQVSLLGARASTHDALTRTAGSHAAAWAGVRALARAGVHVLLKTPVMRPNFAELEAIRRQGDALGLAHVFSPVLFPRARRDAVIAGLRLRDRQMAACMRRWLELDQGREPDDLPARARRRRPCRAGVTSLVLGACGDVLPCPGAPVSAGNIRRAPLAAIWRQAGVLRRLRALRVDDEVTPPGRGTPVLNFSCPVLSLLETGSLAAPSSEADRFNRILAEVCDAPPRSALPCGQ